MLLWCTVLQQIYIASVTGRYWRGNNEVHGRIIGTTHTLQAGKMRVKLTIHGALASCVNVCVDTGACFDWKGRWGLLLSIRFRVLRVAK